MSELDHFYRVSVVDAWHSHASMDVKYNGLSEDECVEYIKQDTHLQNVIAYSENHVVIDMIDFGEYDYVRIYDTDIQEYLEALLTPKNLKRYEKSNT